MEYTGTCRLCGDAVIFNTCNLYVLGEHLTKKHPEIPMTHYELSGGEKIKSKSSKSKSKLSLLKRTSSLLRRKSAEKKNNLYKTTVERWRPGAKPIPCPVCGCCEQPYIRKQKNKVAYNSLGAFFLLGCWPFCFLPLAMCGTGNTVVCCRKCGYCFGIYDRKKGKLIPLPTQKTIQTPNIC